VTRGPRAGQAYASWLREVIRLALRRPETISVIVAQNGNGSEAGYMRRLVATTLV
jgi:hypothetical protein